MTARSNYLRYLELAKQAELAEKLGAEGFVLSADETVGGATFDMIARKDDRTIAYAIKAAGSARIVRSEVRALQAAAKAAGYELRIVVVNPPPRVNVEVDDLQEKLQDFVLNGHFSDELDSLSTHTRITGLSEVEVSDIRVHPAMIEVEGRGTVDVTLEYGGSSDSVESSDSYPFQFAATLNRDISVASLDEFKVDTSSFYEDQVH